MTRDETKLIIRAMTASYPNYKPNDLSSTVDVWATMLVDYDYEGMSLALQSYITTDTSGFAPAIGQLIAKYNELKNPAQMNTMEAWALVSKALRNGYYNSKGEFDKLPPTVQKAVGSAENLFHWSMTDEAEVETVIASNFKKSYETECKRERELQAMPLTIRTMIEGVNQKMLVANE